MWRVVRMLVGYPGYLHKIRGVLLAASVFVVTMAGLALAATPRVAEYTHDRRHDLTPAPIAEANGTFGFFVTGSDRLWSGARVTRIFLAPIGDQQPAPPPGAATFPLPGEAYVSPHLKDLMVTDPLVRDLLGAARVVGTIAPDGLAAPDENRALVGIADGTGTRLTPAHSWGADPVDVPSEARVTIVLGLFLGLLVVFPAIALAAITARLGEAERGDRAAILRMLGAPRLVAAQVSAAEVALAGVPGSVAAAATYNWWASHGIRVPVIDLSVFPEAAQVSWHLQVLVGGAAVGAHCIVAARLAARGRTTQPLLETQPLDMRFLWILVAGVGLLVGLALVTALPPAVAGVTFFVAAAAVAVTMGTALPTGIRWLALRLAPRARRGGSLYGLRLLAERSLPSTRIAALGALLIVALGTAVPFLAILSGGGAPGIADYAARHPRTVVSVFDAGIAPSRGGEAGAGVNVVPMIAARGKSGEAVTVLAATCDEMAQLLRRQLAACSSVPVWISDEAALPPSHLAAIDTVSGELTLPSTSSPLHVSGLPGELGGLLLVPPEIGRDIVADPASSGTVASVPTESVDRYLATISAMAPWAQTRTDSLEASNPDQKTYTGATRLVILAAWTSILLATLCLLAASLGEVAAQRRRSSELDVLGASGVDFFRLHGTTTAGPLLVAGGLATFVSLAIGRALFHMDDRAEAPTAMYVAMAVGTIVVSALTTMVTAPLVRTPHR